MQQGTTRNQRVFVESLGSLPDLVAREEVKPPTIIIVGQVVSLQEKLSWFGMKSTAASPVKPLSGG